MKLLLTTTLLAISITGAAQTPKDSTRVRIGYSSGNQRTTAGAVDQVTQERMNKGLVNNSLDALSGQAAGVQVQSQPRGDDQCRSCARHHLTDWWQRPVGHHRRCTE